MVEEEDMSREIFPLSHYATNRGRLVNEAFNVLRGHRLESTIPPCLRHYSYTELKAMCLEELEKIDTLRIVDIIEGRLTTASETRKSPTKRKCSETLEAEATKKAKPVVSSEEGSGSEAGVDSKGKDGKKKKKKKKKLKKGEEEKEGAKQAKKLKNKTKSKVKKIKTAKSKKKAAKNKKKEETIVTPKPVVLTGERTLMELLELEYRAKAIKALLKFQGFRDTKLDELFSDNDSKPSSVSLQTEEQAASSPVTACNGEKLKTNMTQINVTGTNAVIEPTTSKKSLQIPVANEAKVRNQKLSECCENEVSSELPESVQDSKFELSLHIDEDDELDFGNPDDLPLPKSPVRMEECETATSENLSKRNLRNPLNKKLTSHNWSALEQETDEVAFTKRSPRKYSRYCRRRSSQSEDEDSGNENSEDHFRIGGNASSGDEGSVNQDKGTTEEISKAAAADVPSLELHSEAEEGEISGNVDEAETISSPEEMVQHSPSEEALLETVSPEALDNNSCEELSAVSNKEDTGASSENGTFLDEAVKSLPPDAEILNEYPPPGSPDEAGVASETSAPNQNTYDLEDADNDAINVCVPSKYPEEATPVTWYERWYSSKNVQKVVTSTRMYGKLRSKLKTGKKNQSADLEAVKQVVDVKEPESDIPIIGSIEEYEKLFGKKMVSQNLDIGEAVKLAEESIESSAQGTISTVVEEEEEEEEDDELWGDILGTT